MSIILYLTCCKWEKNTRGIQVRSADSGIPVCTKYQTQGGRGVAINYIKLFILVGWGRSFFVHCLAHRGSTVCFLLLQCFSGLLGTQGSPGVGRNTFLLSPHLCFIIVFICVLFVSRDDPSMS